MVDILSAINTAAKNMISLNSHAAKQLSLEERLLYLQGLALVMNADQEIHEEEKEYLKVLIRSFEIDESVIDTLEEFSLKPDQDTIQSILKAFTKKDISNALLLDMFMVAISDESINEIELSVIHSLSSHLQIDNKFVNEVLELFGSLAIESELEVFKSTSSIPKEFYSHIFEYYDVNDFAIDKDSCDEVFNTELVKYLNSMAYKVEVDFLSKYLVTVGRVKVALDQSSIVYDSSLEMFFIKEKVAINDSSLVNLIKKLRVDH